MTQGDIRNKLINLIEQKNDTLLESNVSENGCEMIQNLRVYKERKKSRSAIMEERINQRVIQKACFFVIFLFSFPLLEVMPLSALVVIIQINFHP